MLLLGRFRLNSGVRHATQKVPMSIGYRALPKTLYHPSMARRFSAIEFQALSKTKLESAPPCCPGHKATNVWYAGALGYVVEVLFDINEPAYIQSICIYTYAWDGQD